jgi:hypothetical protein
MENPLKQHLVEGPVHMASHYTRGSMTTLRDVGTAAFGHFLLGSHNFKVTALG